MTELIRMSAEQMRRKGLENAELKRQREKEYNMKVEQICLAIVLYSIVSYW